MRCFLVLALADLLILVTQTFRHVPIQWAHFAHKEGTASQEHQNFVLVPRGYPSIGVAPPQHLTVTDRLSKASPIEIPRFTARPDKTIIWDATGWCIEAHGDEVGVNRCTGRPMQLWEFRQGGHGLGNQIRLKSSSKCMHAMGTLGVSIGGHVVLRNCDEVAGTWKFEESLPLPMQSHSVSVSLWMRQIMILMITHVSVLALGLGARLWWRRLHARTLRMSLGKIPFSTDQGGVSLTTPFVVIQHTTASSPISNFTAQDIDFPMTVLHAPPDVDGDSGKESEARKAKKNLVANVTVSATSNVRPRNLDGTGYTKHSWIQFVRAIAPSRCAVAMEATKTLEAPAVDDKLRDDDMCNLDEPSEVCAYNRQEIGARFRDRPLDVFGRLAQVALAYLRVRAADDEGATLRTELGKLGPVFCKVGQTMATRPDIIGLETSRNLGKLQDAMSPEAAGPKVAMATLAEALGGEVSQYFKEISAEPVAAASLAEVYKATTSDGVEVAVKIQRPHLERKVALDFYVLQEALALAQRQLNIGSNVEQIVAVLDEVGNGIFAELDFRIEAQNMKRFCETYKRQLSSLGVVVPAVIEELSSSRVLVTEWIYGIPPRDLEPERRQALAKTAVRCLAMQLMTEGFIHCDPHEGNLLALPNGNIALLDFGLMAQMRGDHQEAMAHGVLNIMSENYEALEAIFKGMGVLSTEVDDLRRPGTTEPFAVAIRRCMTGGETSSQQDKGASEPQQQEQRQRRKKIVQDEDGMNRRKAFGQLYEELSELAFKYYFTIPSYYILVMRSFVTLEGIALSADEDDSFNMYEATAPYARKKLLTPRTKGGRVLLKAALFSKAGRKALSVGIKKPKWLPSRRWIRRVSGAKTK